MFNTFRSRTVSLFTALALFALLAACGGGGSGNSTTTTATTPVAVVPVAAAISLSASSTSIASDNSTTTTITATVIDASNAVVSGVPITFAADTGILSASSATSDATGKAVVTFSSGTTNVATRTATITATASGKSTQIPITVAGATATLSATATSLVVGSSPATLTVVVKSGAGAVLAGQAVTVTASGAGAVTLSAASGNTDSTGSFTTTVTPTGAGTVTLTIATVGLTRTISFTVSGASIAFQITAPAANPATASIATPVPIVVSAPSPTTSVTFVATLGTWDSTGSNSVTKPVSGGTVTASLQSPASGVANVFVFDAANSATNSSRIVSFTAPATAAFRVTLQASPGVVAQTRGGTTGVSTLLASVFDSNGNPVRDVNVAFSILNPTGGGETIAPAVATTAGVATTTTALGQATATFTSGSLSSSATGVTIRASIVGTSIATNTSPSGNDGSVVIGGTAGSVTIGRASVGTSDPTNTLYTLPMSVLVADSNGNPVPNTNVSLSAWPIAFNVSAACTANLNPDGITSQDDYLNEDDTFPSDATKFENLSLDPGEDGTRVHYWTGVAVTGGTIDRQLTPPNSASGTLPANVTTNVNGVATFNLTYTKSNALHILDRITARTFVQGTETRGQIVFRLPALITDIGPPCLLPSSPYTF